MTYVLRKSVQVAPAGSTGSVPLKTLEAGTTLESIDPDELAQLAPGHFVNRDGEPPPVDVHPDLRRLAREAEETS